MEWVDFNNAFMELVDKHADEDAKELMFSLLSALLFDTPHTRLFFLSLIEKALKNVEDDLQRSFLNEFAQLLRELGKRQGH